MNEKDMERRPGHDLIGWYSLGLVKQGTEMNGEDLFRGIHLAVDAIRAEGPDGARSEDMFNFVEAMAEVSERLFEIRNFLRKAKGLRTLRVEEALTKPGTNP